MGYDINWTTNKGNTTLFLHPLYIKYSSSRFGNIDPNEVKGDLAGAIATIESAEVCAYLAWLLRMTAFLV